MLEHPPVVRKPKKLLRFNGLSSMITCGKRLNMAGLIDAQFVEETPGKSYPQVLQNVAHTTVNFVS